MTQEVVMLKKDRVIFIAFILCLISCTDKRKDTISKEVPLSFVGENEYNKIYQEAKDTIDSWSLNNIGGYSSDKSNFEYQLDSLLSFNSNVTRFVSCLLERIKDSPSDGIRFIYGEKIGNQWRFFTGGSIVIPRNMIKGHNTNESFSYQQLHEIALKEVYALYLDDKGNINEEWFIKHFEDSGWGFFDQQEKFDGILKGKRFKTKKEFFEFMHMNQISEMWADRDTTKPIIRLDKKEALP
ncbi:MAG: hypothetical protein ACXVC6_09785 [Bacteroidia bacterium]